VRGFLERDLAARMLEAAQALMSEPDDGSPPPSYMQDRYAGNEEKQQVPGLKGVLDIGAWRDRHYPGRDGYEPFHSLTFDQALGADLQRLLGRNASIRYFSDMLAVKMPESTGGLATSWHQDLRTVPHDRAGQMNVWIALDDVPPERGSLRFLTGSHREGAAGLVRDLKPERPDLWEKYPLSEPLHLEPGDATIHHCYTVHGAPSNATDEPRWAYVITYFPGDVRYTGLPHHSHDGLGLTIGERVDDPKFPVVYPV
jgi:hypothetical protein